MKNSYWSHWFHQLLNMAQTNMQSMCICEFSVHSEPPLRNRISRNTKDEAHILTQSLPSFLSILWSKTYIVIIIAIWLNLLTRIWEKYCYNNCNVAEFINEKLREALVYGITPHQPLFFLCFLFLETIETFYFNAKKPIHSHQEPVTESMASSLGCTLTTSAFERSNPWICAAIKSAAPQTPLGRLPVCRSNTTPFTWFSRVRLNPQRWQEQVKFSAASSLCLNTKFKPVWLESTKQH